MENHRCQQLAQHTAVPIYLLIDIPGQLLTSILGQLLMSIQIAFLQKACGPGIPTGMSASIWSSPITENVLRSSCSLFHNHEIPKPLCGNSTIAKHISCLIMLLTKLRVLLYSLKLNYILLNPLDLQDHPKESNTWVLQSSTVLWARTLLASKKS